MDVLIRQAHPGPAVPAYHRLEQKLHDAQRYVAEEQIPWPVLVDDLRGTVHQVYGGLADPIYLIDADGRVAFYELWTDGPTLHRALERLLAQGGRGLVEGGLDRRPHLSGAVTDGWRAIERGLPQSFTDLLVAAPGSPALLWVGDKLRPVLAPWSLRARPLSPVVKLGVGLAAFALGLLLGAQRDRG